MKETLVPSQGQEDPLEEEMPIHSTILAWRIPWTEEPGGYNPCGHKESDMTEVTEHAYNIYIIMQLTKACYSKYFLLYSFDMFLKHLSITQT